MSLCGFELATVSIVDPASTLPKSHLASHIHQIFDRNDWHMNMSMLTTKFEVPLLRVAVHNMAFSKIWHFVSGGCHV